MRRRLLVAFAITTSACVVGAIAFVFNAKTSSYVRVVTRNDAGSRRNSSSSSLLRRGVRNIKSSPSTSSERRGVFSGDYYYALSKETSLCDELVRVSANHTAVVELLTRQQYVAADHHREGSTRGRNFDGDETTRVVAPPPPTECPTESNASISQTTKNKTRYVVIDAFLFGGGEIDTLEMRLYELYPVVDKFIAVTSNATHKGEPTSGSSLLTPLFAGKYARLRKYADKFEIFQVDQRHVGEGEPDIRGVNFHYEAEKERAIAKELALRYPGGGDANGNETAVVIFGHVDEIPARDDVWRIANCGGDLDKLLPGNFGIWFPYGNLEYAFRSDFPARGKPWTLGDPGVSWAHRKDDTRLARGAFPNILGRGFHATNYCFPPQVILKQLTATEYKGYDEVITRLRQVLTTNESNRTRECRAFMATIRDECLNSPRKKFEKSGRMRRVSELDPSSRDDSSSSTFYKPLALREDGDDDGFRRYPCWDPEGVSVDLRAEATVVARSVPRRRSRFGA